MSALVVRRLLVDLDTPLTRHWNGGDAFRTALFNALSFSFPAGEQFFIDSLRRALKDAPPELKAHFDDEVRGFIGQEATHRRVHERFNAHLATLGLVKAGLHRTGDLVGIHDHPAVDIASGSTTGLDQRPG